VTKVLKSAASRGDSESAWLLDKLHSKGTTLKIASKERWVADVMESESKSSSMAQYYRASAMCRLGEHTSFLRLIRQSAEGGYAPAMARMGHMSTDVDTRLDWITKATKLKDPDALFYSFVYVNDGNGYDHCLNAINHPERATFIQNAVFCARYVLYSGDVSFIPLSTVSLPVLYAAGREIEGYDQFWDKGRHPHEAYQRAIDVYLTELHRARRAALQATFCLSVSLGKNVARLIGKMVYQTRGYGDDVNI
jgi:hypothetical protein